MCQYCKTGVSIVNTNMVNIAINHAMDNKNNAYIKCFNAKGEYIKIPFKMDFCPKCGEKL